MDFLLLLKLHDLSVIVPRLEFWRTPESTLKSLLFSSNLFAFALLFSSLLSSQSLPGGPYSLMTVNILCSLIYVSIYLFTYYLLNIFLP